MYAYSYPDDPIINGIIAESGSASMGGAVGGSSTQSTNRHTSWYIISKKVGCGGPEAGGKTLSCMRGKSFADINKASVMDMKNPNPLSMASFGPSADGKVHREMSQNIKVGKVAKVVS
jgi:hypothetical protein